MTTFDLNYTNFSRNLIKSIFAVMFGFFMMSCAHAVPAGIPAAKSFLEIILPYAQWLVPIAGGTLTSVNLWRCFDKGSTKAAGYAAGGAGITCLGFTGLFGAEAATLLI